MAVLDTSALSAVLKTQYTQKKVNNLCYPESPFFAMLKKRTDFGGKNKVVAFQYGSPQGRGANFGVGIGNMSASKYSQVVVTRALDYAFGQVTGEAMDASASDPYSLLDGLKREIDNAIYTCARSIAVNLFGNSGGSRGQISAGSNVATATITLADINQITNFEVGMVLNLSAADGTSGAKRTGTVTITALDRNAGTITAGANWSTITSAAAGDFIFQNGDIEATKSMLTGLAGWIPATAPTGGDNFFGLDRSADPVRLAGVRYTANAGGPIEETLIQCAARLAREGGRPDIAFLNPLDYANLVVALGSKVMYDRVQSVDEPDIGFEAVKLIGPKGPIKVVADFNCPTGKGWMLTSNVWAFESLKGAPRILNGDSLDMLRDATTDSYVFRIGYYGNLTCEAPGWNAYFTL